MPDCIKVLLYALPLYLYSNVCDVGSHGLDLDLHFDDKKVVSMEIGFLDGKTRIHGTKGREKGQMCQRAK